MAAHDVVDGLCQLAWIDWAIELEGEGQVEQRQIRQVLLDPHDLVLRDRERGRPAFGQPRDACLGLARLCRDRFIDPPGELLDRWRLENGLDRQRYSERAGDTRHRPARQQRMAAEIEEIVGDTEALDLEQVDPDVGQDLFGKAAGRHRDLRAGGFLLRRRPQCGAIELAVGIEWNLVQEQER